MTNPAVCHDKVVNQQFAACSGSPHDDASFNLLAQGYMNIVQVNQCNAHILAQDNSCCLMQFFFKLVEGCLTQRILLCLHLYNTREYEILKVQKYKQKFMTWSDKRFPQLLPLHFSFQSFQSTKKPLKVHFYINSCNL